MPDEGTLEGEMQKAKNIQDALALLTDCDNFVLLTLRESKPGKMEPRYCVTGKNCAPFIKCLKIMINKMVELI